MFAHISNYLSNCEECHGKRMVMGTGGIMKNCQKCKWQTIFPQCYVKIKNWILGNPFKGNPVALTFFAFLIALPFAVIYHDQASLSLLVATFGSIFVALKYKLDQASYHKNLFEERYKIFSLIDEVMWEYARKSAVTSDMVNKMNLDMLRKSYFLFSNNTYFFIDKFREALINLQYLNASNETQDERTKIIIKEAKAFLNSIVDKQNLSDKFPEMKISTY